MEIYTVKEGDSLYEIAQKYGVSPEKLAYDNDIKDPRKLSVGESLLILRPAKVYTVRDGDTLSDIARRFGENKMSLWQLNPQLAGKEQLSAGEVLTLRPATPKACSMATGGMVFPDTSADMLRRLLPYLTYVTVYAATVRGDGSIRIPDAQTVIALSRAYGTIPLILVANIDEDGFFKEEILTEILESPENRQRLIDSLVSMIKTGGYGGVELDFEWVPPSQTGAYLEFLRNLKQALRQENRILLVNLPPKTTASESAYPGMNFRMIGEIADIAGLLGYEWGEAEGEPAPIAPLPEVNATIQYAKSEIPASKIRLGVPLYGYNWRLPVVPGESRAEPVSPTEARALALEKKAAIQYDATAAAPYFSYYDTVGGRNVLHTVYFEDSRSLYQKLRSIMDNRLYGMTYFPTVRFYTPAFLMLSNLCYIRKEIPLY